MWLNQAWSTILHLTPSRHRTLHSDFNIILWLKWL
jgi:hypothetical protein